MKGRLMERLQKELSQLEYELRVELPRQIKAAVAMGDLRENAEYQTALERQGYVKLRVGQLRKKLGELSLLRIESIPKDRVGLGSRVVLEDDSGREVTYELVLPDDGDVPQGRISIASPIGKSLMGRKEGDEVTVRTPSGEREYEILELRTLHDLEAADDGKDADP